MAASPKYKVFDSSGNYQASCKEPCAAAALLATIYNNGTIRVGHRKADTVYVDHNGSSGESYDLVSETIYTRLNLGARIEW